MTKRQKNLNFSQKREISLDSDLKKMKQGDELIIRFHSSGIAPFGEVTCTVEDPKKKLVKNPIGKVLKIFTEGNNTYAELCSA
jgi:hypothetical protein